MILFEGGHICIGFVQNVTSLEAVILLDNVEMYVNHDNRLDICNISNVTLSEYMAGHVWQPDDSMEVGRYMWTGIYGDSVTYYRRNLFLL